MQHLTWLTDIHLNFLDAPARQDFYDRVAQAGGDGLIISGDIGEAPSLEPLLKEMQQAWDQPIYFVLGNHDFYKSDVSTVRDAMRELTVSQSGLHWLPQTGPVLITDDVVLLGQDGWADARYGDYDHSWMAMNDSRLIEDLHRARVQGTHSLKTAMQQLADEDAHKLDSDIQQALADYHPSQVIVATHVPPFKEACFHRGQSTGDDVIPFYTSKATGDVLLKAASNNPHTVFYVICGHTHGQAFYQPINNLRVNVGGVTYGDPQIQAVWSFFD